MDTFAYELVCSLDERWNEVDILVVEANKRAHEETLYNALCRSTTVLIVAHFEGFIKDTVKAVLNDINRFSNFSSAPYPMKRTFCNLFFDVNESGNDKRINNLIRVLEGLDTQFVLEPFLFDNNKNPSPNMIEKICKKFGIEDFFVFLENSILEDVFKNDKSENLEVLDRLKTHVREGLKSFPYSLNPEIFKLNLNPQNRSKKDTMWKVFLDETLKSRHLIAHGTDLSNGLSTTEILDIKLKIQFLQYSFALIVCSHCNCKK